MPSSWPPAHVEPGVGTRLALFTAVASVRGSLQAAWAEPLEERPEEHDEQRDLLIKVSHAPSFMYHTDVHIYIYTCMSSHTYKYIDIHTCLYMSIYIYVYE